MAGVKFKLTTGEVATTTSARTILQLLAATDHRVTLKGFSTFFKGVAATDPPILVRLLRQTSAGTMSALTPTKANSSDSETLEVTGQHTATVEPSGGDLLWAGEVHPQAGYREWFPFGEEIVVPGGTRVGLQVTATVSVSCVAQFDGEE